MIFDAKTHRIVRNYPLNLNVFDALSAGAVDFVRKPDMTAVSKEAFFSALNSKIHIASFAKIKRSATRTVGTSPAPAPKMPVFSGKLNTPRSTVIALGASTGGTEALTRVLTRLPAECPPIVITQHMPAGFTASFVQRLDRSCALTVHEAQGDEVLEWGHVYLAPGSVAHMAIRKVGAHYRTVLIDSEPVNRHKPAVDVLFHSVAKEAGRRATGIVLTGMGRDGADGLLAMRQAGADTFVQDEASSVVFGMPKEALHNGAADEAVPLDKIGERLFKGLAQNRSGKRK